MARKQTDLAVAYYRYNFAKTESDDNFPKQQRLVRAFAKKNKLKLVGVFVDGVRQGEGFERLLAELDRCREIKTVIVADASVLSRSPIDRETIILIMRGRGIRVVTCAGDDLTDDPARATMRAAAFNYGMFEAANVLQKVRAAIAKRAIKPTLAHVA